MTPRPSFTIAWQNHCLNLGSDTCIMGVLNITPDSFSDGGLFFHPDDAIHQALSLQAQGADILDIGGESTRPFSDPVTEKEEIRRVVPVIEAIAGKLTIPISIDTCKSGVARHALDAGASIINDISALRMDPEMAVLAAERDVPVILMHMLGTPKTMQVSPVYANLIEDIRTFFKTAIDHAVNHGISRNRLIIDPGIGFGKTIQHNLTLINRLMEFWDLNLPILMGVSRKSTIRNILKKQLVDDPDMEAVETGSLAAHVACILNGAHIIRVHDVARNRIAADIADALKMKG